MNLFHPLFCNILQGRNSCMTGICSERHQESTQPCASLWWTLVLILYLNLGWKMWNIILFHVRVKAYILPFKHSQKQSLPQGQVLNALFPIICFMLLYCILYLLFPHTSFFDNAFFFVVAFALISLRSPRRGANSRRSGESPFLAVPPRFPLINHTLI